MATSKEGERTQVSGSSQTTIDFDLLDDEVKKQVIECIKDRSKISVVLRDGGVISADVTKGFRQLID